MSAVVEELIQSGIATKNEDESVGVVFDDTNKKEEIKKKKEGIDVLCPLDKGGQGGLKNTGNLENLVNLKTSPALPSCILQKRDGTHGYLASDLAAIKYRLRNWNPSKIMYFVDNRQALHFKQLFATAGNAWLQDKKVELTHAANGFVSLPE